MTNDRLGRIETRLDGRIGRVEDMLREHEILAVARFEKNSEAHKELLHRLDKIEGNLLGYKRAVYAVWGLMVTVGAAIWGVKDWIVSHFKHA